ncbi:hypothetical protein B0T14DRAFT_570671 [Immersiella caudata]|uniref:MYND-type domain-containing protein n=1 Tax=Immersiella caudata TaxID=314043 RepID=A0AA39WG57_9PEZI|nr:hypothetical protein B0T14DRAFT_570671 [Immersiella caudata]
MDISESGPCVLCNKPSTAGCLDCNDLLYCSEACLLADKPHHALLCHSFSQNPPTSTTGNRHVRAFSFPADTTEPKLVWVPVSGFADPDTGISFQEADIVQFFPPTVVPQTLHAERNSVRHRESNSMLEIWHTAAQAGSANRCIESLAKGKEGDGLFYDWKGGVLVLAMTRPTGFMVDPGAYKNAQARDFRDAVDFLVDYGNTAHAQSVRETLNTLGASTSTAERSNRSYEPYGVTGMGSIVSEME